ncbi:MAG: DUF4043 family protein [Lysobacter sp.]|nr:DUF4043 family protein [Lysobacter sp.]
MKTDFGAQQTQQRLAWGHKAYEEFIEQFFFTNFLGEGEDAIIEHITELSENDKGQSGAMLHLIADLHGGGIAGDGEIEGRESELSVYWQEVQYGMISKAVTNKGKLADSKSVIQFRVPSRKKLARWLAETMEEQAIHFASGIPFTLNLDGSPRQTPAGEDPWTDLDYSGDIAAPTANRFFRYSAANGLQSGDTTQIAAADTLKYGVLPDLVAEARTRNIKPIRKGGREYYVFLTSEKGMAQLWKDPDFRTSIVQADTRGDDNKIFSGSTVTMHNLIIRPYRRVYNTRGAASGQKWGAGGAIDGARSLLLGAQALAFADIAPPDWEEKAFNYGKRQGISLSKMMGWLKPKFYTGVSNTVEDFGVAVLDHAMG